MPTSYISATNSTSYTYIEIVIPFKKVGRLTYRHANSMHVEVGGVVLVPFGNNRTLHVGIVLAINTPLTLDPKKIKTIKKVLCQQYFSPAQLQALLTTADYYLYHLGDALHSALPPCLRVNKERTAHELFTHIKALPKTYELWQRVFDLPKPIDLYASLKEKHLIDEQSDSFKVDFEQALVLVNEQLEQYSHTLNNKQARWQINNQLPVQPIDEQDFYNPIDKDSYTNLQTLLEIASDDDTPSEDPFVYFKSPDRSFKYFKQLIKAYGLNMTEWQIFCNIAAYAWLSDLIFQYLQLSQPIYHSSVNPVDHELTSTELFQGLPSLALTTKINNVEKVEKLPKSHAFITNYICSLSSSLFDALEQLVSNLPKLNLKSKAVEKLIELGFFEISNITLICNLQEMASYTQSMPVWYKNLCLTTIQILAEPEKHNLVAIREFFDVQQAFNVRLTSLQDEPLTIDIDPSHLNNQPMLNISYAFQQRLYQQLLNTNNVLRMNAEQQHALDTVVKGEGYQPYLIDGVTGSGKTEVFLQIMAYYLSLGKSCLVLVPEIGLTPQTISRFNDRFKVQIEVMHSNIPDAERNRIFNHCQTGKVAILVGTRSAVFAPLKNLGVIIIDEEHDASYKQHNDWRYHARDYALTYAKNLNIPVVMGSATPSFNSLYQAEKGNFQRLVLTKRARAKYDNKTVIVDIRKQDFVGIQDKKLLCNKAGITSHLWGLMQQTLNAGNQVMLFLNRRGFAPQVQCLDCNYVLSCYQCDQPFTYHRANNSLMCHRCGISVATPTHCPNCGSSNLQTFGAGTEQIAALVAQAYNPEKVIRIDRDTSGTLQSLEKNLEKIHKTKGAILIGTQMLAKGHHFPSVTLVGILNIDGLMLSKDYRATEQLAQLYIQVAGRAGREEKPGTVVLQTSFPFEPIFNDLLTLSYYAYSQIYLRKRKDLGEPPYQYQAYIGIRTHFSKYEQLLTWAQEVNNYLHLLCNEELQKNTQAQQLILQHNQQMQAMLEQQASNISQQIIAEFNVSLDYFFYLENKLLEDPGKVSPTEIMQLEQFKTLLSDPYKFDLSFLTALNKQLIHFNHPSINQTEFFAYQEEKFSIAWLKEQERLNNQFAKLSNAPSKYQQHSHDIASYSLNKFNFQGIYTYIEELTFELLKQLTIYKSIKPVNHHDQTSSDAKLECLIRMHDLGKQNNHNKIVIDFICSQQDVRYRILQKLTDYLNARKDWQKEKVLWYIDIDPITLI